LKSNALMENDKDTEKKELEESKIPPLAEQAEKPAKRKIEDMEERFSRILAVRATFYGSDSRKRVKRRRKK